MKLSQENHLTMIERLSNVGKENSSDVVIGVGGGKNDRYGQSCSDSIGVPVIIALYNSFD